MAKSYLMAPTQISTTTSASASSARSLSLRSSAPLSCARLPARYHSDTLHQTHLKVCLPWRSMGRLFCRNRLRLFRSTLWRVLRHLCPLGRPLPYRPEPSFLVPATVLLHRRLPDFLLRFSLLPGRRSRVPFPRVVLHHPLPVLHHRHRRGRHFCQCVAAVFLCDLDPGQL